MPDYETLLQHAENMQWDLLKCGLSKSIFKVSFFSQNSTVDLAGLKFAKLIEKTALVLPIYPAETKKIKFIILYAICLYVWSSYESQTLSIFTSPLVSCLKKALEIDSPSNCTLMQLKAYYAVLEKFSQWVFSKREEVHEIESLYAAFPEDMQMTFQVLKCM